MTAINLTKFRKDVPTAKEFSGKFPKTIRIFAYVGIKGDSDNWCCEKFCFGKFFHIAQKYDIGVDVGCNEHGVPFEIIAWTELPKFDDANKLK